MATASLVVGGTQRKAKVRLGPLVERILGYVVLAVILIWFVANLVADPDRFLGSLLVGLQNGLLYALVALGYTMVYGIVELINFAHGDLFMLTTIIAAGLMVSLLGVGQRQRSSDPAAAARPGRLHGRRRLHQHVGRVPRLPPAPVGAQAGAADDRGRPLASSSAASRSRSTSTARPRRTGRSPGAVRRSRASSSTSCSWSLAVTVPLLLLMTWIVSRTKMGKAMRAVAQDQDGARLMGINVNGTISFVFGLGGALAGAAGVLYFLCQTQTYYDTGTQLGPDRLHLRGARRHRQPDRGRRRRAVDRHRPGHQRGRRLRPRLGLVAERRLHRS